MVIRILITFAIWLCTHAVLIPLSFLVVPIMLYFGWSGYTTWFGNRKYGRYGNTAHPSKNTWDDFVFLTWINPVSNFGKEVMSVVVKDPVFVEGNKDITDGAPGVVGSYVARSGWKWEVRIVKKTFPGRCFEGRWGWKLNGKQLGEECTFVCRANPFKKFG